MEKAPASAILSFFELFLLVPSLSAAQTLQEYNVDFHMAYSNAVVEKELLFNEPLSGNIILELPKDAKGISVYIDDAPEKFSQQKTLNEGINLNIGLNSSTKIKLSYVTKELLSDSEFLVSLRMPYDAESLNVMLLLPEDTVLERPLPSQEAADIAPSPVYPLPKDVTTDGRQIKLIWRYNNLREGEEKSFFVRYKREQSYLWIIILLVIIIIGLVAFVLIRKPKVEKVIEKVVEKEDMLEKHLKEDEEQVVNILKQREGQCEQGTLRVITGFSKAKLSGLLKELEERNVIYKEKRGKKNLVFLRKL